MITSWAASWTNISGNTVAQSIGPFGPTLPIKKMISTSCIFYFCTALLFVSVNFKASAETQAARPSLDLSGEWEFKTDPLDIGRAEKWFEEGVAYDRKIKVPGAWNTQGVTYESDKTLHEYEAKLLKEQKQLFGLGTLGKQAESEKLFSVYPGPGWYRKKVSIPADWGGKIPWLVFGGVHREAEVWVNGHPVGSDHSYLTPFRIDLSDYA